MSRPSPPPAQGDVEHKIDVEPDMDGSVPQKDPKWLDMSGNELELPPVENGALVTEDLVVASVIAREITPDLCIFQPCRDLKEHSSWLWWRMPKGYEVFVTGKFFEVTLEETYQRVHQREWARRGVKGIIASLVTWCLFVVRDVTLENTAYRLSLRAGGVLSAILTLLLRRFAPATFERYVDAVHMLFVFSIYVYFSAQRYVEDGVQIPFGEMLIIWCQHAFLGIPFYKMFLLSLVQVTLTIAYAMSIAPSSSTILVLFPSLLGTIFASQGLCILLEGQARKSFAYRTRLFNLPEVQRWLCEKDGSEMTHEVKEDLAMDPHKQKSANRLKNVLERAAPGVNGEIEHARFTLRFRNGYLERLYQAKSNRRKKGDLIQWISIVLSETIAALTVDWLAQQLDQTSTFLPDVLMVRCLGIWPCALSALALNAYQGVWKQHFTSLLVALAGTGTICTSALVFSASTAELARGIYKMLILRCFFLVFMIRIPRISATVIGWYLFAVYVVVVVLIGQGFMAGIYYVGVVVAGPYIATVAETKIRRVFLLDLAYRTVLSYRLEVGQSPPPSSNGGDFTDASRSFVMDSYPTMPYLHTPAELQSISSEDEGGNAPLPSLLSN